MSSMSCMSCSEPPLKEVKVEHEPDRPFGCPFCFETCGGRGRGIDVLVCKGCETTWYRVWVKSGTALVRIVGRTRWLRCL